MEFTNCPSNCVWVNGDSSSTTPGDFGGDIGYAPTQRWGAFATQDPNFIQSFVSVRPAPAGSPASLGTPFLLTNFARSSAVSSRSFMAGC